MQGKAHETAESHPRNQRNGTLCPILVVDASHFLQLSKDPKENPKQYYKDVEMQGEARKMAEQYNKLGVPKQVDFVEAFVAVLPDRYGGFLGLPGPIMNVLHTTMPERPRSVGFLEPSSQS